MKFKGEEAITKPTRATARTVTILSLSFIFVEFGWLEIADSSVIGFKLAEESLSSAGVFLIGAALVAHMVQWNGDRLAFDAWNVEGLKPEHVRFGGARRSALDGTFDDLLKIADRLRAGEDVKDVNAANALQALCEQGKTLLPRLERFGRYGYFYVWGWDLALPAGIALICLILLLSDNCAP